MDKSKTPRDLGGPDSPHFTAPDEPESPQAYSAWEEVDAGRYMPRRIRGSCQGRALG